MLGPLETGGDDRDLHLAGHLRVDHGAEDDVGVFVRRLLDDRRGLADFDEREVRAAGDVDDHAAGAADRRVLEQRAGDRQVGRVHRALFAFGQAGAHDGEAHAGHDRLHVGEVEVDQPRHQNQVRNALNRLPQHVVCAREGVVERGGAGDGGEEPFVGDGDDRVDGLAQLVEAALGLQLALAPLEPERLGDDRNRQRAELAGQAGDDRRGTGAGAAAQAGGDEDHVRAVERFDQLVGVFEGRLTADVRIGAGAEPLGQLRADLELVGRGIELQRLQVGVDDDELDAVEAGGDHAVDGVAAAAADADDLDPGAGADLGIERQTQCFVLGIAGPVSRSAIPRPPAALRARNRSIRKIP